jgi:soluble epoxide hydrolase / lipid-phosphate phosphatase
MAVVELDQNIRRSVRATLRTVASPPPDTFLKSNVSYLSAWDSVEQVSVLTNIISRTDTLI